MPSRGDRAGRSRAERSNDHTTEQTPGENAGQRPLRRPLVYRLPVGAANFALAAMLVYGIRRYAALVVPRYGHQFAYVPVLMAAVACWMVVRGVLVLTGRSAAHGG